MGQSETSSGFGVASAPLKTTGAGTRNVRHFFSGERMRSLKASAMKKLRSKARTDQPSTGQSNNYHLEMNEGHNAGPEIAAHANQTLVQNSNNVTAESYVTIDIGLPNETNGGSDDAREDKPPSSPHLEVPLIFNERLHHQVEVVECTRSTRGTGELRVFFLHKPKFTPKQ